MGRYTDLLYAQPTFLEGIGRLVDFAGTLDDYNVSASPAEADRLAMASDCWAGGEDMKKAVASFAHQNEIRIIDERHRTR
jgi:hypothetical protein